jgi:fumarate hydratase subunit alpha/L(+)-tartrate dehydratase alpha subunit
MKIDPHQVEEAARELYIRALKILPPDVKAGFERLARDETDATAQGVLGTMIRNIRVAEEGDNLLCQDTGIPIYHVTIGRGVQVEGAGCGARSAAAASGRRGSIHCARRSSIRSRAATSRPPAARAFPRSTSTSATSPRGSPSK